MLKDSQYVYMEARKQKQADRQNIREAIYLHKREEMLQVKRQKEMNENKKKEIQTKIYFDNKMRQKLIKEQEEISQLRRKEFMEAKIRQYRLEHERRMAEEEAIKQKKELEVLNMEKLEMELIRKLQHTQLLQKAAYEELESALAQPPEEYERKYLHMLNGYGGVEEANPMARLNGGRYSFSGTKSGLERDDSFATGNNERRHKTPTPQLRVEGAHSNIHSKSENKSSSVRKPSEDLIKNDSIPNSKEDIKNPSQKESIAQDNNSLKDTENKDDHQQGTERNNESLLQSSTRKEGELEQANSEKSGQIL